jgi:SRSO17 transposase
MSDPITVSEQRLQEYLSRLTAVLGHADRKARLVGYCTDLLRMPPLKAAAVGS